MEAQTAAQAESQDLHLTAGRQRPARAALPGPPSLPFHTRCNLQHAARGGAMPWIMMACAVAFHFRGVLVAQPPERAWLQVQLWMCMAHLVWSGRGCSRPPQPSDSYVRWRELPLTILRSIDCGLGYGAAIEARILASSSSLPPPGWLGHLQNGVRLLHCSAGLSYAFMLAGWRVRFTLSVLAQAVATLTHSRVLRDVCEVQMVYPSLRTDMKRLHRFVRLALLGGRLPLSLTNPVSTSTAAGTVEAASDAVTDCTALLTWLLLGLGLVLPLLVEAAAAARLFHAHQQERRAAGLPPERGMHALLYKAIWRMLYNDLKVPMVVVLYLLLAGTWDLCVLLARPRNAHEQA